MSFYLKNSSPRGGREGVAPQGREGVAPQGREGAEGIRPYGKTELAILYNPHLSTSHARRKLMHWINRNHTLTRRLQEQGYTPTDRIFSPKMVQAIFEELCEP